MEGEIRDQLSLELDEMTPEESLFGVGDSFRCFWDFLGLA